MTAKRFPIEPAHILMFARAIGDDNDAFVERDRALAPPTFAMAGAQFDDDNPLRPRLGQPWFGSGREPSGEKREGGGALHAEQHFIYHRPLYAGMVLTGARRSGDEWEKQSKRGGTLRFSEDITDYHDAESGELVVTLRMVRVRTEGGS